jgi:LysM domain-containing protein
MSAMPAEAEPGRPGPGAEPPITRPKTATKPETATRPETAEPPIANALPAQRLTGQPRATQARTATTGAAAFRTAEAEPPGAVRALRPATVRPRQVGLMPSSAPRRPRPAGLRLRRVSTRLHPTGVRACSDVLRAEPPAAALPVPQVRPSLPGDAPQRLRLTRRGRVVLGVFAAVVMSLVGLAAAGGTRTAGSVAPAGTAGHSMTRIVVQPGQTLWTIAMRADPQADPRLVVQRIIAANSLRNGTVQAGQSLLVPRS